MEKQEMKAGTTESLLNPVDWEKHNGSFEVAQSQQSDAKATHLAINSAPDLLKTFGKKDDEKDDEIAMA
jgi:hypothetical protein